MTPEQRRAINWIARVSAPYAVARAVENAIEVFQQEGWPDGMAENLMDTLESAYCDHGHDNDATANHIGELHRELTAIVHPDWPTATSPGTL